MLNYSILDAAEYEQKRYQFLTDLEESGNAKALPYVDSVGIATIGIGMNLRVETVRMEVLAELGFDVINPDATEQAHINNITAIVNRDWRNNTTGLREALDGVMRQWTGSQNAIFAFPNGLAIRNVFDRLVEGYEDAVNEWLPGIPDSQERLAIVSLSWAGLIGIRRDSAGNPLTDANGNLLYKSPSLRNALLSGNRAEAWYEIRYNTNSGNSRSAGIAKRRYYESQLFGLYARVDIQETPEMRRAREQAEAIGVYRMFTRHREVILAEERAWGAGAAVDQVERANRDYGLTGTSDEVQSLQASLSPAYDYWMTHCVDNLAAGLDIDYRDIQVAADIGSELHGGRREDFILDAGEERNDLLIGQNGGDILIGNGGKDVLHGQGGHDDLQGGADDDYLFGGAGIDTLRGGDGDDILNGGSVHYVEDGREDFLFGGAGFDTYYAGNGDRIIDADGFGRIIIGDRVLIGGGQKQGDESVYYGDDGTLYLLDPDGTLTVVTPDGERITIVNHPGARDSDDPRSDTDLGIDLVRSRQPAPPQPPLQREDLIPPSPLALDLNGDGIVQTTSLAEGVHFDLDNSGFAEATGFIHPDDGLLVWDRNQDGVIANGKELFGDQTLLNDGTYAANGFIALAELDDNRDGIISQEDAAYAQLHIWQDLNRDGHADAIELQSLSVHEIAALNLNYRDAAETDAQGNLHLQIGSYVDAQGVIRRMDDVYFQVDKVDTEEEVLPLNNIVMALPDTVNYGNARSLRQEMVRDSSGELQALVEKFVGADKSYGEREALIAPILFKLTHQQAEFGLRPGIYEQVDIRVLGALEKFSGRVISPSTGPGFNEYFQRHFNQIVDTFFFQLSQQSYLKFVFDEVTYQYDERNAVQIGDYSDAIPVLLRAANATPAQGADLIKSFVHAVAGINPYFPRFNIKQLETDGLDLLAKGEFSEYSKEDLIFLIKATRSAGDLTNENLNGTDADDFINGFRGNDVLSGHHGNDTLLGGEGEDGLYGGAGEDVLDGGVGKDYLEGGIGGDTYLFRRGQGADSIRELDWTAGHIDTIQMQAGILPEAIRVMRDGNNMRIKLSGTGDEYLIYDWFSNAGTTHRIERVTFTDSPIVWNETDLIALANTATEHADHITGGVANEQFSGLAGDDKIYAGAGNDHLQGDAGDDCLYGESGNDFLSGGVGKDALLGGHGEDVLYGNEDNDQLMGDLGNDFLDGGPGDDKLNGGHGNDIYVWGRNQGADYIFDNGESQDVFDTIQLSADLAPTDIDLQREGYDLWLVIKDSGERLIINRWYDGASHRIEQILFHDGTLWDSDFIARNTPTMAVSSGNDRIYGTAGNDIFDSSPGNDVQYGYNINSGAGNDTYIFRVGCGKDIIIDKDTTENNVDTIKIVGVSPVEVSVSRALNPSGQITKSLEISFNNGVDSITVENYFAGREFKIERIEFDDGTTWTQTELDQAIAKPRVSQVYGTTETEYFDLRDPTNTAAYGYNLTQQSSGADHYIYGAGGGRDTIQDFGDAAQIDTLQLTGVMPGEVSFSRPRVNGFLTDDLQIRLNDNDILTIRSHFRGGDQYRIEQIKFDDGTVLDGAALLNPEMLLSESGMGSAHMSDWSNAETNFSISRFGDYFAVSAGGTGDQTKFYSVFADEIQSMDPLQLEREAFYRSLTQRLIAAMATFNVPEGIGGVVSRSAQEQYAPMLAEIWQSIS